MFCFLIHLARCRKLIWLQAACSTEVRFLQALPSQGADLKAFQGYWCQMALRRITRCQNTPNTRLCNWGAVHHQSGVEGTGWKRWLAHLDMSAPVRLSRLPTVSTTRRGVGFEIEALRDDGVRRYSRGMAESDAMTGGNGGGGRWWCWNESKKGGVTLSQGVGPQTDLSVLCKNVGKWLI
ncbi:hypothetical protein DFH06DRAFT_1129484 [Mycena polygramma]|nr:hypothetical protein DFH06DRAFT_1129484 [Mycena polygramma]